MKQPLIHRLHKASTSAVLTALLVSALPLTAGAQNTKPPVNPGFTPEDGWLYSIKDIMFDGLYTNVVCAFSDTGCQENLLEVSSERAAEIQAVSQKGYSASRTEAIRRGLADFRKVNQRIYRMIGPSGFPEGNGASSPQDQGPNDGTTGGVPSDTSGVAVGEVNNRLEEMEQNNQAVQDAVADYLTSSDEVAMLDATQSLQVENDQLTLESDVTTAICSGSSEDAHLAVRRFQLDRVEGVMAETYNLTFDIKNDGCSDYAFKNLGGQSGQGILVSGKWVKNPASDGLGGATHVVERGVLNIPSSECTGLFEIPPEHCQRGVLPPGVTIRHKVENLKAYTITDTNLEENQRNDVAENYNADKFCLKPDGSREVCSYLIALLDGPVRPAGIDESVVTTDSIDRSIPTGESDDNSAPIGRDFPTGESDDNSGIDASADLSGSLSTGSTGTKADVEEDETDTQESCATVPKLSVTKVNLTQNTPAEYAIHYTIKNLSCIPTPARTVIDSKGRWEQKLVDGRWSILTNPAMPLHAESGALRNDQSASFNVNIDAPTIPPTLPQKPEVHFCVQSPTGQELCSNSLTLRNPTTSTTPDTTTPPTDTTTPPTTTSTLNTTPDFDITEGSFVDGPLGPNANIYDRQLRVRIENSGEAISKSSTHTYVALGLSWVMPGTTARPATPVTATVRCPFGNTGVAVNALGKNASFVCTVPVVQPAGATALDITADPDQYYYQKTAKQITNSKERIDVKIPLPNLSITKGTLEPVTTTVPGDLPGSSRAKLTFTISNNGRALLERDYFMKGEWLKADGSKIEGWDINWNSYSPVHGVLSSNGGAFTWSNPSVLVPADGRSLKLTVDPNQNGIPDADATNNSFTISRTLPDLTISDARIERTENQHVVVRFKGKGTNLPASSTGMFQYRLNMVRKTSATGPYELFDTMLIQEGVDYTTQNVDQYGRFNVDTVAELTVPNRATHVLITIDPLNTVVESNELNNKATELEIPAVNANYDVSLTIRQLPGTNSIQGTVTNLGSSLATSGRTTLPITIRLTDVKGAFPLTTVIDTLVPFDQIDGVGESTMFTYALPQPNIHEVQMWVNSRGVVDQNDIHTVDVVKNRPSTFPETDYNNNYAEVTIPRSQLSIINGNITRASNNELIFTGFKVENAEFADKINLASVDVKVSLMDANESRTVLERTISVPVPGGSLNAGMSIPFNIPNIGVVNGAAVVHITVDPANTVIELDDEDNINSIDIPEMQIPEPVDLEITEVTTSISGNTYTARFKVKNVGRRISEAAVGQIVGVSANFIGGGAEGAGMVFQPFATDDENDVDNRTSLRANLTDLKETGSAVLLTATWTITGDGPTSVTGNLDVSQLGVDEAGGDNNQNEANF